MLKTSYNCEVAEERSPAEYHIIANSPHMGDTRTKSITKGISTVSVSKRTQMPSKNRDCRRPIFSPNGHLTSSDSMRQMVPVVHVELSSGTKRTENSDERNLTHPTNFNTSQKRPSQPVNGGVEGIQEQQIHYNNILAIMKDQLNKSVINLQKRADQQIRKNEEAVMILEKKLKETQNILNEKIFQIAKLKENSSIRPSLSKKKQQPTASEINSYLQYLSGKLRDVDIKINILIKQHTSNKADDTKLQSLTKRLQQRIQHLGGEFIKMQLNKFNSLSTRVTKFVESRDKLLQNLITTTEQVTKKQKQPIQTISLNLQKYEEKMNQLKANQQNLTKTLEKFGSKEFKYDHFEVENLKSQLKRLSSITSKIQNEQAVYLQKQFQSLPVIQKPITSLQSFNEAAKKPQPQVKQYLMNSKLSFTGQTCSFEDYHPPNDGGSEDERDHFFYPEQDTSYQRFTDEQQSLMEEQTSEAVVQLTEMIRKRRMKMPVKCSINQGYVKLVDVGTYILDMKGSLMEFSNQDIETALGRKIILL